MKHLTITLLFMTLPFNALAELYPWVDSHGTVNYTNNPKNLPKSVHIPVIPDSKTLPSEQKKNHDESAKIFIDETIENIKKLSLRIEKGIKYVDEYQEKNRPVSKYVLISYINSLSNEISNLKGTYTSGSLDKETKKLCLFSLTVLRKNMRNTMK